MSEVKMCPKCGGEMEVTTFSRPYNDDYKREVSPEQYVEGYYTKTLEYHATTYKFKCKDCGYECEVTK